MYHAVTKTKTKFVGKILLYIFVQFNKSFSFTYTLKLLKLRKHNNPPHPISSLLILLCPKMGTGRRASALPAETKRAKKGITLVEKVVLESFLVKTTVLHKISNFNWLFILYTVLTELTIYQERNIFYIHFTKNPRFYFSLSTHKIRNSGIIFINSL